MAVDEQLPRRGVLVEPEHVIHDALGVLRAHEHILRVKVRIHRPLWVEVVEAERYDPIRILLDRLLLGVDDAHHKGVGGDAVVPRPLQRAEFWTDPRVSGTGTAAPTLCATCFGCTVVTPRYPDPLDIRAALRRPAASRVPRLSGELSFPSRLVWRRACLLPASLGRQAGHPAPSSQPGEGVHGQVLRARPSIRDCVCRVLCGCFGVHPPRGAPMPAWFPLTFCVLVVPMDFALTFVTPALAYTTRSAARGRGIGFAMIRQTWPRCAFYVLCPPLAVNILSV